MSFRKHVSPSLTALCTASASLALLTIATGCVTTPKPSAAQATSLATPAQWQHSNDHSHPLDSATLSAWWRQFNDPVLDQLIAEALRANPDIRTALSRLRESRAQLGVQRSTLYPSVNASVSGQGSRREDRLSHAVTRSEGYSASLDAAWEVDLFGRLRASTEAAAADLARSEEDVYAAQVSLAAEVAANYVTLRSAEAQYAVVEKSLSSRGETLQLLQWQQQAGVSDALATQQAVSTYEQARASLPSLQQTVEQTRNALAILTGQTPGKLDALLVSTAHVPSSPSAIAVGIPAQTLAQRPDVRAAAESYRAAAFRTTAAERNRLPSLNLSGSIGVDALKAGKLFDPASIVASLVGGLTAPIFDAGRLKQTANVQNEQQQQALISYESTVLTALGEVENALIAVQRSAEKLAVLDRAVAAAREASDLANLQYQSGSVDILTVLDAQRTLLSIEQQQVTTLAEQTTAHIQLYKTLGGGWTPLAATQTTATASL